MPDRYNFRCFRPLSRHASADSEPRETMRHQTTKALYAYWDALRAGRLAPLRNEVEPADIAALLPNAFILERTGRDAARFRMAGEAVCDLIGLALDGMSAAAIWEGASRLRIAQMIEGVVSAPAAAIMVGQSRAVGGVQGADRPRSSTASASGAARSRGFSACGTRGSAQSVRTGRSRLPMACRTRPTIRPWPRPPRHSS